MNGMLGLDGLSLPPPARRDFIMGSLMVGFTAATAHGQAAPIHTDASGLTAGEVQVPVSDGNLPAYAASPAGGGTHPVVIVIEEIFGVHEYIKDTCRRLAKLGYMAVAPEFYARLGDLSKMTDVQQIIRDVISKAPDAQFQSDLTAAVAWARASGRGDKERLAVTGFCRGGRQTWLTAESNTAVRAAVAWYGPVTGPTSDIQPYTATDLAAQLKCPLLGLYGGADTGIPVDQVRTAEGKAKAAGKTIEIVVYPDTPHGFHADYRPSYRKDAAEDGWQRMLAWFKQYGV
jgi:carboxymethylenebutenolidase